MIKVEKTPESESVNVLVKNVPPEPAKVSAVPPTQPLREEFALNKQNGSSSSAQHSFQEPVNEERISRASSSRESISDAVASDGNVSGEFHHHELFPRK